MQQNDPDTSSGAAFSVPIIPIYEYVSPLDPIPTLIGDQDATHALVPSDSEIPHAYLADNLSSGQMAHLIRQFWIKAHDLSAAHQEANTSADTYTEQYIWALSKARTTHTAYNSCWLQHLELTNGLRRLVVRYPQTSAEMLANILSHTPHPHHSEPEPNGSGESDLEEIEVSLLYSTYKSNLPIFHRDLGRMGKAKPGRIEKVAL